MRTPADDPWPDDSSSVLARELAEARALEARDGAAAGARYVAILARRPDCLEAHNALERLKHPQRFSGWMRVNCTIHPEDDIFRFIAGTPGSLNPVRDYLADGWRTLGELMVLLERLGRPCRHRF